jgi:hypothetical protein
MARRATARRKMQTPAHGSMKHDGALAYALLERNSPP